jgi:hypothetical protein
MKPQIIFYQKHQSHVPNLEQTQAELIQSGFSLCDVFGYDWKYNLSSCYFIPVVIGDNLNHCAGLLSDFGKARSRLTAGIIWHTSTGYSSPRSVANVQGIQSVYLVPGARAPKAFFEALRMMRVVH